MKKNKIALILATDPSFGGGHQYAMLVAKCLVSCSGIDYDLVAICYNFYWYKWCKENKIPCLRIKFPVFSKLKAELNFLFPFFLNCIIHI